jgi:hypothetical protein
MRNSHLGYVKRRGGRRSPTVRTASPAYYPVRWAGTDDLGRTVASGTYFYVLKADGRIAQKRMLLVR